MSTNMLSIRKKVEKFMRRNISNKVSELTGTPHWHCGAKLVYLWLGPKSLGKKTLNCNGWVGISFELDLRIHVDAFYKSDQFINHDVQIKLRANMNITNRGVGRCFVMGGGGGGGGGTSNTCCHGKGASHTKRGNCTFSIA